MNSNETLTAQKNSLRQQMRERRNALSASEHAEFSRQIGGYLRDLEAVKNAQNIALYLATRHEANLDAEISYFLESKIVAVPAVGLKPRFALLESLDDVKTNARGLRIPRATTEISERETEVESAESENGESKIAKRKIAAHEIEVVVVPALAFDKVGNRLGQGGGWYDRVLDRAREKRAKLGLSPLVVVGVGFDFQMVESVPIEAHDARLDFVITQNGAFRVLETHLAEAK